MPPVAKPVPAIASIKAEPVPQTAKGDDGKEFLYATKVSPHHLMLVLPAVRKKKISVDDMLLIGLMPVFIVAKYAVSISASTMPLTPAVAWICQDLPDLVLSRSCRK